MTIIISLSMIQHLFIVFIILGYASTTPHSLKAVAVVDNIQIDLQNIQTHNLTHQVRQHQDYAFMLNVQLGSSGWPFPQLEVNLLNRDGDKATCTFKYETHICVIERSTSEVKVQVKCLATQCKANLIISQRVLYSFETSQSHKSKSMTVPGEIYKLKKHKYNSILEIFSELKEKSLKPTQIKVYSNFHAFRLSQVEQLDSNSVIFGLKPILHDDQQYFYVENEDLSSNHQLKITVKTHEGLLRDGVSVVDFIQTFGHRSSNLYDFDGGFSKNIVVYARVFAPHDPANIPFGIVVEGRQLQEEKGTVLSEMHLSAIPFEGQKFYDISWTITKTKHSGFKIVSFTFQIDRLENSTIFIEVEVQDSSSSEVKIFDEVYFSAGKEQDIHFTVTPQAKYQIVGSDRDIPILTNATQRYLSNSLTCSLQRGCDIDVKTTQECEVCSFKFDLKAANVQNHIIYYQVKQNQIDAKVDFDEVLYFKKTMEPNKFYQVVVNTPNIILYANFEDYQRCRVPSAMCHQYAINQQNPTLLSNRQSGQRSLVIALFGLEKTLFRVRFIENMKGLSVGLGEKFSYLFDDEEEQITLEFRTDRETFSEKDTHLHFNLISPVNSLELTVSNQDGLSYKAVDGYIQYSKKDIAGEKFTIVIKKMGMYVGQYVHMTLIVSTSTTRIRLDSTSTHYQKYLPAAQKQFILDYNPNQKNAINIFTENLQKQQAKMKLTITDINLEEADEEKKPFIEKIIERDNQAIDLDLELENADICEDVNCELEITITSLSKQELEQSITVLHEESVILLDDSIWTSFEINELSKSNHFYYLPRQQNKPIQILFESDDRSIFIDYLIFNTNNSLNPQNWPWDHHSNENKADILSHLSGFQQFSIPGDSLDLKNCWPHCVILITVGQAHSLTVSPTERQLIKTYKILVSSTVIEAPEDTRFQVTMQSQEENSMFIFINNFIKSEAQELTFFTEYKVGRAKVMATLLSEGREYNLGDNDRPFIFQDIETHLPVPRVRLVLDRYHLNPEKASLKVTFKALSTVQMYFQFTSYMKNFYRLNIDDLEIVTLREGEEIWYQFIPERDFSIKIYRAKGFPLFKIIECQEESYIDCLTKHKKMLALQLSIKKKLQERLKTDKAKANTSIQLNQLETEAAGKQLQLFVDKNYEYSREMCEKCIIFIWVYGYAQDLQLSINIRTSNSEVQLKEMAVINDRIEKEGTHNKYLINVQPQKAATVTFRLVQGECLVEISDRYGIIFNETFSSASKDYRDINVEALSLSESETQQDTESYDQETPNIPPVFKSFARKKATDDIFRHLHVRVTSTSERAIEYLLSYSIGFSGFYLQDGLVSQKKLLPQVAHIFYYHNKDKKSNAYLSLSSTPEDGYDPEYSKNEYEVRFFYYQDANRRDIKEEFRPEMPPKKNQNYLGKTITHVYELPARFELFQIEVYTKSYLRITASINHKELIYLPLGFQYLIKLHSDQSIYLVVDRPPSEYLQMSIKKCDTSVPTLYYTNDARQFQEGLYEAEEQIENSYQKKMIKTKKNSKTIHFKLTAEPTTQSLFTVSVQPSFDPKNLSLQKVKAGSNGLLSYRTIGTEKVEVEFSPVTCDGKECTLIPQYYLLVSSSLDSIYGQLNCAGTYMITQTEQTTKPKGELYEVNHKHYDKGRAVFKIEIDLKSQEIFIGVKAVVYTNANKRVEVMYNPTEIQTIWKQISKISISIFLLFSFVVAFLITLVIVISTKLARRGYRPISAQQ